MVENAFLSLKTEWLEALKKAGVYAPAFELSEIIESAAGVTKARQLTTDSLTAQQRCNVEALLERRLLGEPLQYILGKWEFYGLPFYVGEGVLIPRADTETLVEVALKICKDKKNMLAAADLCSGSGCVAIALAHCLPQARVTAAELSPLACEYIIKNIALNGVKNVELLQTDVLAQGLPENAEYDIITANPPYICTGELADLQKEVKREPVMALDGGADGLLFYRVLAEKNKSRLKKGGWFVFEVGDRQSKQVSEILFKAGYINVSVQNDLAGFARVVYAQYI
ncbi:MAG: peptide chain release factor N(5)-glutamine methyltransferase [Hydrogenoanaerobacterium sp.]